MNPDTNLLQINALSIDVEDYFHVSVFEQTIHRNNWEHFPGRVEQNTEKILNILREEGIKATFFILGWVAQRYPDIVKAIQNSGHEIATHGYSHELITRQTPDIFYKDLKNSIDILQDITRGEILGYRAPSFSVTPKTLWAIDIMMELGLKYDSSIFPIRHDYGGYPNAPTNPYKIKGDFWEFPLTTYKFLGINIPIAGGGYFRIFPYGLIKIFFKAINRSGLPFIFYIHPWELDKEQPKIKQAPFLSRFRQYQNLEKTEDRFKTLCRDFKFATIKEVLENLISKS